MKKLPVLDPAKNLGRFVLESKSNCIPSSPKLEVFIDIDLLVESNLILVTSLFSDVLRIDEERNVSNGSLAVGVAGNDVGDDPDFYKLNTISVCEPLPDLQYLRFQIELDQMINFQMNLLVLC